MSRRTRGPAPVVGWRPRLILALICALVATSAGGPTPSRTASSETGQATPFVTEDDGVAIVEGSLDGQLALGGPIEPYAVLTDLTGFIERDLTATLPPESQVIAPFRVEGIRPIFTMSLPVIPQGRSHVFGDEDAPDAAGVQVFSVNAHADLTGGPFLDPSDFTGWPVGYSTLALADGSFEVEGGSLLAWAPDDRQAFPTGYGADGRLFTPDDPVGPLPAGWTLVGLDAAPFSHDREAEIALTLREGFGAVRDLTGLGWAEGFDRLVRELRARYPFTGHKDIDWGALAGTYRPLIAAAEAENDEDAYNVALLAFANAVGDGHLAATPSLPVLMERYGGSTGLTLGRIDTGTVFVTDVAPGSPAEKAGIAPGAIVGEWAGRPIREAIAATPTVVPTSTGHAADAQRLRLLPLGREGTAAVVSIIGPGSVPARQVTLEYAGDTQPVLALVGLADEQRVDAVAAPVTAELLPSGVGYVRVRSFAAAPALVASGWDHAIRQLGSAGVTRLVVDLRGNGGGVIALATYLAGTFVGREVNLADLKIANDEGEFVTAGKLLVRPGATTWEGDFAVLVDSGCLSACEMLAAALAPNPRGTIIGHEPTAGVVATVFFWVLPGGVVFQAPLGRYEVFGEIWLEGEGVAPEIDVPVTRRTLLSDGDPLLDAALTVLERE